MRAAVLTLAAGAVVALALPARADEEYKPKDAGFSVKFPGKPKEMTQTTKTTVGEIKVVMATYATPAGVAYLASHNDLPFDKVPDEQRKLVIEGVVNGIKGADGKVIESKDVEFGTDKLPGKTYTVDKGK